jgi:hypothetical protein
VNTKRGEWTFEGIASQQVSHHKKMGRWIASLDLKMINDKEEMMKRLIYLTVVLMIGFICFGCSGMSAEERKETYDLRKSVGDKPFVGGSSKDARSLFGEGN